MNRAFAAGSVLLASLLLAAIPQQGVAQAPAGPERVTFPFPKDPGGPKFVDDQSGSREDGALSRWVWNGESIDNWVEALEIVNVRRPDIPPALEEAFRAAVASRQSYCPGSTSRLISSDSTSILYEITTRYCLGHADEISLTRIIRTPTQVFSLIYTNKAPDRADAKRQDWIRVLSEAKIEGGGGE